MFGKSGSASDAADDPISDFVLLELLHRPREQGAIKIAECQLQRIYR
jgi:hypothetical protein